MSTEYPMVLLRSLSRARTCNHTRAPGMVRHAPRLSSSCARKELIKVTGRSIGRSVGSVQLVFSTSLVSNPKRLDPIQCSAKVLCNRSSARGSRLEMFLPPVSISQRQAVPTSVNISDACSGRSNTCLINRIIRRLRGSLKVHLSGDRAS